MSAPLIHTDTFFLDHFALRQWTDPEFAGTRLAGVDQRELVERVQAAVSQEGRPLVEGCEWRHAGVLWCIWHG